MDIDTVEKIYNDYTNKFGSYKLTLTNGTVMSVPLDDKNRHYIAIQQWIADGGTVIDNRGGE